LQAEIARWAKAERLKHSWIDVGPSPDFLPHVPDRDIERALRLPPLDRDADERARSARRFAIVRAKMERGIHELAAAHGLDAWSDADVLERLERAERAEARREVGEM